MNKFFSHPLMHNNFSKADLNAVIKLLNQKDPILTQSKNVQNFELEWSKWLGVKYSTFVNSGSSANLISINILKEFKKKGEIIVPSLTWVSDITSVIFNNFKPVFVDLNLKTLSMSEEGIYKSVTKKTVAVFLTHAQGFNGLSLKLLRFLNDKKIILIEDVCESHGATLRNKKLGSFGLISNFSFYYAHHMSTIEGGMICTNNRKVYELSRMLRSHGMAREIGNVSKEKLIIKKNKNLSPKFIFLNMGFNMRNTEIGGVLGLSQLKKIDKKIIKRNKNFYYYLKLLDSDIFYTNFDIKGCSNYAFPLILKKPDFKLRNKLEYTLNKHNIEFRRGNAGGGNQLRQPYLQKHIKNINFNKYKNTEHVHFFGYYIGNFPSLTKDKIKIICDIINSIKKV